MKLKKDENKWPGIADVRQVMRQCHVCGKIDSIKNLTDAGRPGYICKKCAAKAKDV